MAHRSYYDVSKVFLSSFNVGDIVDPLPSFDATTPAEVVREALIAIGERVAGVREGGFVARYVTLDELGDGPCGDNAVAFEDAVILAESTLLSDLVHALNENPVVFVRVLGEVGGIVHRHDLEDPPVRMWLFGLLTSLEQRFVTMIRAHHTDESWQQYVSAGRLEKAHGLLDERMRRRQGGTLLGCLQFADKAQIMVRDEFLRMQFGFASRKRAEETIKGLEKLRNNLAHAQPIAVSDWEMIVRIVENLDRVMAQATAPIVVTRPTDGESE